MRLLPLIGSLLLSVTQVMVSVEPIKAEITEDALDEYCWSNMLRGIYLYSITFFGHL